MPSTKQIHPVANHQTNANISTNEFSQASELQLHAVNTIQIRTFHTTWITFWICFFVWFCTTNIYYEISKELQHLTLSQHQLAGALSITSTIFFRPIIAWICFRYGSKISYLIVLICTAFTLIAIGSVQTPIGYILCHIFLGISGASFVITQYHTTRMFSSNIVGQAQAMTAGFGNFGGGCANFIMPILMKYTNISYRWYMIIFAAILFAFCFVYYLATNDIPSPNNSKKRVRDRTPDKIVGVFKDAASDYRAWILFFSYAACFGVEITFYLIGAQYFQKEYNLDEITSGLVVFIWSSINILARPLGSYLSNKYSMQLRVKILFTTLFVESTFIILFGIIGHVSMLAAMISLLLFSVCVNISEGIIFNIVPFIQSQSIGHVFTIVGSGGNFGATVFIFAIFMPWNYYSVRKLDAQYAWIILGIVVMMISFVTLLVRFTKREIQDFDQREKECYNLVTIKTDDMHNEIESD